MKALTDKIIDTLTDRKNSFIGSLKNKETMANSAGFRQGIEYAIEVIETAERQAEFEEIARVMMKHLGNRIDLYCPMHSVIIDSVQAQLVQGVSVTGAVMDYITD